MCFQLISKGIAREPNNKNARHFTYHNLNILIMLLSGVPYVITLLSAFWPTSERAWK